MNPPGPIKPSQPRRPLALTIAAWTALNIGIFLPIVPGVILYLLIPVCREVGVRDMLRTGPGLKLAATTVLSTLCTLATLLASVDYFRSRPRRANRLVLVALTSGLLSALLLVLLIDLRR